tara:strand:+ start:1143 stop:1814 length:672 start_codon:yes stop_codon:yes gene_type:complete
MDFSGIGGNNITGYNLGSIVKTGINAFKNIFGKEENMYAIERPQTTDLNTTSETSQSGMEGNRGFQGATFYPALAPIFQGIQRNLPGIGRALGLGGGGALAYNALSGGEGEVCAPKSAAPYSVNKTSGCISVSRKQQARLKEMVSLIGLEQTAEMVGLDPNTLVMLLLKRFKARGRGITAASMRTTKRTIRQIKTLHSEVASMAGRRSVVRRGSTTKTSIVKA